MPKLPSPLPDGRSVAILPCPDRHPDGNVNLVPFEVQRLLLIETSLRVFQSALLFPKLSLAPSSDLVFP